MKRAAWLAPMLFVTVGLAAVPPAAAAAVAASRPEMPNIVLILADDAGIETIGAYGGEYRTPRIDQLAREGVRFDNAHIVRVYSKVPGHPPDTGRPFTLRGGGTVRDVAQQVHRGMAAELKFARVWGRSAGFDGQQVSAAHPVADRNVVELHW